MKTSLFLKAQVCVISPKARKRPTRRRMSTIQQKATPNANGNLFEVKTVQSGAFRTLIEALKEILTEANLEFDSQGMKIVAVDETHTVLVYLRLHADRFENFYCPVKHVLGVNMIYLFKLIKTMGNNDSLTIYLPANNPNKLGIRMENTEKSQVTNFFLKLFDTDVEDISIPSLNFTSIIHMHSADFQKICRDMNVLGEKMEITSSGTNLIFRCVGDFAEQETVIADNQASMKVQTKGTTTEIVQGIFQLKHLVLFTKCTTLCPSIELYLKNDYPLILRYMVANLGEVKLVLAPIKNKKE
jgi:proliferating cell nuclear antigen